MIEGPFKLMASAGLNICQTMTSNREGLHINVILLENSTLWTAKAISKKERILVGPTHPVFFLLKIHVRANIWCVAHAFISS